MPDREADAGAHRLQQTWEDRARSPARDFFVASHPGWDDPAQWEHQARHDTAFMLQRPGLPLHEAHVLDVGCGVGRLVPYIAPHVRSLTCIDISPSMLAEAQRRCGTFPNVRFLESDGLCVPPDARDRGYQYVIAHAVFIHCPREVVAALCADCWSVLVPGGELRFQLLADAADRTGLDEGARTGAAAARAQELEGASAVPRADRALVRAPDYLGHAFRMREAEDLLREASGARGELRLGRPDGLHIYGVLRRATPA